MRPEEFLPPERAQLWPPLYQRVLSHGPYRTDYSLLDGRTIALSFNPIVSDGKITGISVFGKDITERKTAERALLAAEEKYKDIFDGAIEGMYQTSAEGKILTANRALARMLGYDSPEELVQAVGDTARQVWADADERARAVKLFEAGSQIRGYECQFRRRDGSLLWVSLNIRRVLGADGQLLYFEGFMEDITQRKLAEDQLREAEQKHRGIFNGALEGMFQTALSGRPLNANPALAKMLGYHTVEDYLAAVTDSARDVWFDPADRARYVQLIEGKGSLWGFECRLKRKDGTPIWVALNTRKTEAADGTPVNEGFIEDITERKQAEAVLQSTLQRFYSILSSMYSGILVVSEAGQVEFANPAFCTLFGLEDSPESLMELSQSGLLNKIKALFPQPDETIARIKEMVKADKLVLGEEILLLSGRVFQRDFVPLKVGGNSFGRLWIHTDITERKQAEETLRERERMLNETGKMAKVGGWELEPETSRLTWTREVYRIHEVEDDFTPTLERAIGFYRPESRPVIAEAVRRAMEEGEPFDVELEIVTAKNKRVRVQALGRIRTRDDGTRILSGMFQDITERKLAETKLRDSEERFRATFEQAAVGMVHTSLEGRMLRCNARFAEILGYAQDEIPGMTFQQITAPEDLSPSVNVLEHILGGDTSPAQWEKRYVRKDGSLTWAKITLSVQRDADGQMLHCIGVVEDINDRKATEARLAAAQETLKTSEARYRTVFHTSLDGISITRLSDGAYIDANQAYLNMMGYEYEDLIGRSTTELSVWTEAVSRQEVLDLLQRDKSFKNLSIPIRRKSGEIFWIQVSASVVEVDGVPCMVSVLRDTTETRAAEEKIKDLAFYDPLTHLPNRRQLTDMIHQAQAGASRGEGKSALLFVDLDNFKILNDALGHHAGDLLLKEVGLRLSSCVRQADTVARLGGDEFAVMLKHLSESADDAAAQAAQVGEKILAAIGLPYTLDGHDCHCASSIGIAIFGDEVEIANDVLKRAEIAMFEAKEVGRNTLRFFAPDRQAAVNARATMEEDLRQAVKANQFVLYYQPQVERGRLTGVEALIRWNHPGRGILAPDEFIHLAEQTGLILPIGKWVLETACAQIVAWSARPETAALSIAVNISARQMHQLDFVEQVRATLVSTGANPQNLRLELTESMLLDRTEEIIAKMTALRSDGLRFSLDDFGTGYSSLSYLKRLPLDRMKIDRSFVQDILEDATSGAIAQTIIALSRALGLSVIAEGVETEEQRGFLIGLGCHAFQGYLFSRPLPLDQFEQIMPKFAGPGPAATK